MNYKNITLIIFIIILAFFINKASALDCSACHTTDPEKSAIKAKDTIEISENTCLKCHNPEYPPTPMGYNTHLVHVGKYTAKVDYLKRHPTISKSLDCNTCHREIDCRSCHIKNIPHVKLPLGDNCRGCHGEIDKLFRHPDINLKIHDVFNLGSGSKTPCTMCHNPDNMRSLKLASGEIVPIDEPHRLCYQCHSPFYNLWDSGSHYAKKTPPKQDTAEGTDTSATKSWEEKWRKENTCTNCHNPHRPDELYQIPDMEEKITHASNISPSYSYLYIAGILMGACAFIIIRKKKINLKLPSSLPKLKSPSLPKLSLPISISIEEPGKVEPEIKTESRVEKKKIDKIELGTRTESRVEKKKLLRRNDILFFSAVGIMFVSFYIVFGAFMPVVALVSESMSPHMEEGDIVFYTDISRIDEIITHDKNAGYRSFEDYGYVIIYKPFGREGVTPYIHRAMYYVNEGEEMWPGGPKAPHAGYITKGDNTMTNPKYDQQVGVSYLQPVKREWIIGIARYRIPLVGYIRMILSV